MQANSEENVVNNEVIIDKKKRGRPRKEVGVPVITGTPLEVVPRKEDKPKMHYASMGLDASILEKNLYTDLGMYNYIKSTPIIDSISYNMIDLKTGQLLTYEKASDDYLMTGRLRPPLWLKGNSAKLYYGLIGIVLFVYDRKDHLKEETFRIIEASIYTATTDFRFPMTCIKNPKLLICSSTEQISYFWSLYKNSAVELFAVADCLNKITLAVYTGGVPPFRSITELEALQAILKFLKWLFKDYIPTKIQDKMFVENFLKHLCLLNAYSTETFNTSIDKVGVPFTNGFAHIPYGAPDIELIPYSRKVFVTENVISGSYIPPKIQDKTIMLSRGCKLFLENICINDPYIYTVLRGLLRTVLTTKYDGRSFQSAVWICGPPGCAKSVWVHLLKRFVAKTHICEFAHTLNQFTGSNLKTCRLLLLSDITDITQAQYKLIKPILGRDSIREENKFESKVGNIDPMATIVCVSNFLPTEINHIKTDEAVLEKLIVVQFPPEASIPSNLQIPDIASSLDAYLTEIFNWAMYAPLSVLKNHIRATNYNNYLLKDQEVEAVGGLPGYIRDSLVFDTDPDSFINIIDLRLNMEQVEEQSGDDLLKFMVRGSLYKESNTKLGQAIANCIKRFFGKTVTYQKYSKRDRGATRPMGFKNLSFKSPTSKKLKYVQESFEYKFEKVDVKLDCPFYTEQRISWLSDSGSITSDFEAAQLSLKEYRDSISLKSTSSKELLLTAEQESFTSIAVENSTLEPIDVSDFEEEFFSKGGVN